ncbi:class I SAM-dependent methyltransferase [Candidatus Gracilibacteria bacterium]|nr:class I SAM-dependent methyltransferase [Candidatus Gracilibacteria bacterium]
MLFTGERAHGESFWGNKRFADHYERYDFAKNYCKDKVVLDIASGSGYGSFILSKRAKKVIGVDISQESIDYCKKNIKNGNLEFVTGNGKNIPLEDNSCDLIVSFETIEHILEYDNFLSELKRVLQHGGKLIISTPNFRGEIIKNKYHVSNFTTDLFIKTVSNFFNIENIYYQGKHFYPFPGRGILESLFGISRNIKIHSDKPDYNHHVTIIEASK